MILGIHFIKLNKLKFVTRSDNDIKISPFSKSQPATRYFRDSFFAKCSQKTESRWQCTIHARCSFMILPYLEGLLLCVKLVWLMARATVGSKKPLQFFLEIGGRLTGVCAGLNQLSFIFLWRCRRSIVVSVCEGNPRLFILHNIVEQLAGQDKLADLDLPCRYNR